MNCSRVQDSFIDYQDGTLPDADASALRLELARLRDAGRALRARPAAVQTPSVEDRSRDQVTARGHRERRQSLDREQDREIGRSPDQVYREERDERLPGEEIASIECRHDADPFPPAAIAGTGTASSSLIVPSTMVVRVRRIDPSSPRSCCKTLPSSDVDAQRSFTR